MQTFDASPAWVLGSLWRHRILIWELAKRDVVGRYKGAALGIHWALLYPVMMIAIYTFVFSDVFKLRWAGGGDSKTMFATMVFAGLIVHGLFAECLTQGPSVIVRNPTFVKKIIFPLETLPWVTVLSALFHTAVGAVVLCLFIMVTQGALSIHALWLPLVFLPLLLMAIGLCWFLASLGVYLRDVAQITSVFERFYARIQQQLCKQGRFAQWLFELSVDVGWQRFQRAHGRARWSSRLLLWPLLRRVLADKVVGRLGGRLRLAVSGGAALAAPIARTFVGLGLNILQGYGLTETSPVISVNTVEDNDPASVGPPLPGIDLRLDEGGELQVRGPGVMMGYWKNPEATTRVLDADGWLHTGDRVEIREGRLYITGRLKDILVLSNGENVAPVEMEGAITLDGLFEHVMIVGEGRPFLSAILVPNAGKNSRPLAHALDL